VTTISYGAGVEGGKGLTRKIGEVGAVESFQLAPRGSFSVSRRNLFGKDRSLSLVTRASFLPPAPTLVEGSTQVIETGRYGFNEYVRG